jgi:hypothetical protein
MSESLRRALGVLPLEHPYSKREYSIEIEIRQRALRSVSLAAGLNPVCRNSADGSSIDVILVELNDFYAVASQSEWYSYAYADKGAASDARIMEDVARELRLFLAAVAEKGAPRRPAQLMARTYVALPNALTHTRRSVA